MLDIFAPRPAEDVLSRSVRITLGDREFTLAVLFIAGNERWKAMLEASAGGFVDGIAASQSASEVLEALGSQTDALIDLLVAYDTDGGSRPGVLPSPDEIKGFAYETDLTAALLEVWRAANPLVVMRAKQALQRTPTETSSPPSPTSPASTGSGRRKKSASH